VALLGAVGENSSTKRWSEFFLSLLLLLNLTGAKWVVMGDAERTQDRQTESWGQVCWALGWGCTVASLLLFSILFIHSAFFLYLYPLRPYSFTIL
jgi:hypothetical protein